MKTTDEEKRRKNAEYVRKHRAKKQATGNGRGLFVEFGVDDYGNVVNLFNQLGVELNGENIADIIVSLAELVNSDVIDVGENMLKPFTLSDELLSVTKKRKKKDTTIPTQCSESPSETSCDEFDTKCRTAADKLLEAIYKDNPRYLGGKPINRATWGKSFKKRSLEDGRDIDETLMLLDWLATDDGQYQIVRAQKVVDFFTNYDMIRAQWNKNRKLKVAKGIIKNVVSLEDQRKQAEKIKEDQARRLREQEELMAESSLDADQLIDLEAQMSQMFKRVHVAKKV